MLAIIVIVILFKEAICKMKLKSMQNTSLMKNQGKRFPGEREHKYNVFEAQNIGILVQEP